MKKGDLVVFNTERGSSPIDGMFGVLLGEPFKDGNGYENAKVYFANAPRWPKRTISLRWLKPIDVSRQN
jgi:hypothetical protein